MTKQTNTAMVAAFMKALEDMQAEERAKALEEFGIALESQESINSQFQRVLDELQAEADKNKNTANKITF